MHEWRFYLQVHKVIIDCTFPVYGAALRAVLKRCDVDGDGSCSWPEVTSFFERAMQLLLDDQLMTSAEFERFRMQRLEDKTAAELRMAEAVAVVASTARVLTKHCIC